MKITQYGRSSIKELDFAKALVEIARLSQVSGDNEADAYTRMAVYTAARLCTNRNGVVRMSEAELAEFLRENAHLSRRCNTALAWPN